MTRYSEPEPGEWIRPKPVGYKLACCDCGLVHRHDFRIVDGHVEFRVWPANRETGQMRRHMKPGELAAPVAGEPDRGAEGRDTYRPDPVEGRRQTLRCGTCHRTLSRCKCAGRGLAELPKRIVVGKNGAYWRDYGDHYSMCPVSEDNDPVEPVALYVLQRPEDWFPEAEHTEPGMGERARAITLATWVLDRPNADPDDDLAIVSRQFLRCIDRAGPAPSLPPANPSLMGTAQKGGDIAEARRALAERDTPSRRSPRRPDR